MTAYDTPSLPFAPLEEGFYYLTGGESGVLGRVFFDVAAAGCLAEENVVLVAVGTPLSALRTALEERLPERPPGLRVVTTAPEGAETPDWMTTVASPADLTGLGMAVSAALEAVPDGPTRVCVDSVGTLLSHAGTEAVFEFCHVLSNRVGRVGGLGVAGVDTDAVGETTLQTLLEVATGRLRLRGGDEPALRVVAAGVDDEWRPL